MSPSKNNNIDYTDDLALLSDMTDKATKLFHLIEELASEIGLCINAGKIEFISYNREGEIKLKNQQQHQIHPGICLPWQQHLVNRDIKIHKGKDWGVLDGLSTI